MLILRCTGTIAVTHHSVKSRPKSENPEGSHLPRHSTKHWNRTRAANNHHRAETNIYRRQEEKQTTSGGISWKANPIKHIRKREQTNPTKRYLTHLARAWWSWLEDLSLLVGRKRGVDGTHQELFDARPEPSRALRENLCAGLDLVLSRQEDQYVPGDRLRYVRLRHEVVGCMKGEMRIRVQVWSGGSRRQHSLGTICHDKIRYYSILFKSVRKYASCTTK